LSTIRRPFCQCPGDPRRNFRPLGGVPLPRGCAGGPWVGRGLGAPSRWGVEVVPSLHIVRRRVAASWRLVAGGPCSSGGGVTSIDLADEADDGRSRDLPVAGGARWVRASRVIGQLPDGARTVDAEEGVAAIHQRGSRPGCSESIRALAAVCRWQLLRVHSLEGLQLQRREGYRPLACGARWQRA
jgi:hypothetical protein